MAVIGVLGEEAESIIGRNFASATDSPWRPGQIRYGTWLDQATSSETPINADVKPRGESVVLTPIGDRHYEVHGHGGAAAVNRIITSLVQLGAIEVAPEQFVSAVNEQLGTPTEPLIREAESVLVHCTTRRNAAVALAQTRGAMLRWAVEWTERIENERGKIERDESRLADGETSLSVLLRELRDSASTLLSRSSIGLHLAVPYRVVLAGPPNVGKSSLINQIVGYGRSITHDAAGTTRDVVDCDTVIDGLAIRLGDTAGIRSGGGVIEQEGIRRGTAAIASADLIVMVVDPASLDDTQTIEATIRSHNPDSSVVRVINKYDLISNEASQDFAGGRWLETIASSEESQPSGIDKLIHAISTTLRPSTADPEAPVPVTTRQVHWLARIAKSTNLDKMHTNLQNLRDGTSVET
ncbi:tRNA modification GTPase TrmE [Rhodopirellula sallentina SM41]|uniref:tRNA modification GTPase TrmE n=1 Tax=Rhodopirellula sallentina SM41 TaxID=1263870 RepID=M5UDN3_9BACT|nr:tRNA modification GTPase TrmE [Rhodopirellula sallentina SM41]